MKAPDWFYRRCMLHPRLDLVLASKHCLWNDGLFVPFLAIASLFVFFFVVINFFLAVFPCSFISSLFCSFSFVLFLEWCGLHVPFFCPAHLPGSSNLLRIIRGMVLLLLPVGEGSARSCGLLRALAFSCKYSGILMWSSCLGEFTRTVKDQGAPLRNRDEVAPL
jgi:energy-coupling factor transporter transmembrane protein EcfT